MPIHYDTDPTHRRLSTHADGVVTFDEINAHLDTRERNRDLDLPELFDARRATTDLTTAQVHRVVQRASDILRVVRLGATAIVTTDEVFYGRACMYSILAQRTGVVVQVFRDVEAAKRWLDQISGDEGGGSKAG